MRSKPKNSLLILFVLVSKFVFCQTGKITNPAFDPKLVSSDVATLGKYTSMEVSLNTGAPNISIPLYTINYGGMEVPITLSYDSSGVKTEEISSSVGLKWSLNVGGAVGRYVKGAPDEGTSKYSNIQPCASSFYPELGCEGYYIDYGLQAFYNNFSNIPDSEKVCAYDYFYKNVVTGSKDTQPDLFFFNSLGHSGRFFFDDNKNPKLFTEGDYKIETTLNTFLYNSNSLYNKHFEWKITSPDGIQMWFGQNQAIERSLSLDQGDTSNAFSNPYIDNSYNLTKIINSKNQREITISYENSSYKTITINNGSFVTELKTLCPFASTTLFNEPSEIIAYSHAFRDYQGAGQLIKTQTDFAQPLVKEILAGDTKILFYFSNREDLLNGKKIDKMEVYYKSDVIKQIVFNYGYFNYTGANLDFSSFLLINAETNSIINSSHKRLKLVSIEESGNDLITVKRHQFEYDETYQLPSTISFAKDMWGYFNGAYLNKSLFPRYSSFESNIPSNQYHPLVLAKAAISRKVNSAFSSVGTLKKIIYPTGGSTEFEFENHQSPEPIYSIPGQDFQWTSLNNGVVSSTFPSNVNHYDLSNSSKLKIEGTFFQGTYGSSTTVPPNCQQCGFENVRGVQVLDANGLVIFEKFYSAMVIPNSVNITSPLPFSFTIDINNSNSANNYDFSDVTVKLTSVLSTIVGSNGSYPTCFMATATVSKYGYVAPTYSFSDYLVGGLRVKKIKFKIDNSEVVTENNYTYTGAKLINKPKFTYSQNYSIDITRGGLLPLSILSNSQDVDYYSLSCLQSGESYFVTPGYNPNEMDFSGPHISYNFVTETNGNGYTKHQFFEPQNYSEAVAYSSFNNVPYRTRMQSSKAGKLISKEVFDVNNIRLKKEQNIYSEPIVINSSPAKIFSSINVGTKSMNPDTNYTLTTEYVKLDKVINIDYFNGNEVKTETNYFKDSNLHHQNTRIEVENSTGDVLKTEFIYAPDLLTSGRPFMQELNVGNFISEPVISKNFLGSQLINYNEKEFAKDATTNNLLLPKYVYTKKDISSIITAADRDITFNYYDSDGNLTEYSYEGGSHTSIIWGYDKTLPIAKIENATNAQIALALNVSDFSSITELDMGAINNLRSLLPNSMTTTYTFSPLVGIQTVTDPKGDSLTYEYDTFNRLKAVYDKDGHKLSENDYHYRTQN